MYQRNQDEQDLVKMQRQLAILQRSGGSATQIRNLQQQIDSKQQDAYFDKQQQQIDVMQEASNKQIERLDAQIELMTETLEYQKENGLWWTEVAKIMQGTPESIVNFIQSNTPEYLSNSEAQIAENVRELLSKVEQWVSYRKDAAKGNDVISKDVTHDWETYKNNIQ